MKSTTRSNSSEVQVAFLTPLRKKDDPHVWSETCRLLEQTIDSLRNQYDERFVMCIAGHDCPEFLTRMEDPRFVFAGVSFGDRALNRRWQIDKAWKIATAAQTACSYQPRYYMSLDADDLLHADLVSWFSQCQSPAVICDNGWEVDLALKRAVARRSMSRRCQSTIAFKSDVFPLPLNNTWKEWEKVPFLTVGHGEVAEYLRSMEVVWSVPPMRSVAYLRGHGSNVSDTAYRQQEIKRMLGFKFFGKKLDPTFWDDYRLEAARPGK